MIISIVDAIDIASFRAIPFRLTKSTKEAGRRTIKHVFPNNKYTFIEDLGANPRTFEIEGTVCGNSITYFVNKVALESALDREGYGWLTHPTYGVIKCICEEYKVEEHIDTQLGFCTFKMKFIEYTEQSIEELKDNISIIKDIAKQLLNIFLTRQLTKLTCKFVHNIIHISDNTAIFSNNIYKRSNLYGTDNNIVETKHNDIISNRYNLAKNPQELSQSFTEYINDFKNVLPSTFESIKKINEIPNIPTQYKLDTAQHKERFINDTIFNSVIDIFKFTTVCTLSSAYTFDNTQQIDNTSAIIRDMYNKIQTYNIDIQTSDLTVQVFDGARSLLDKEKANISNIITVDGNNEPLTVFLYKWYGHLNYRNQIIKMNPNVDIRKMHGNILITRP